MNTKLIGSVLFVIALVALPVAGAQLAPANSDGAPPPERCDVGDGLIPYAFCVVITKEYEICELLAGNCPFFK